MAEQYAATIDEAQARFGEKGARLRAEARATVALFRGDLDTARSQCEEWVAQSRRSGEAYELSQALIRLSLVQAGTGSPSLARHSAEEALQVARATGVPSALAGTLVLLPWSLLDEGTERALHLLDEAIEVGTEVGGAFTVAAAVQGKGPTLPQPSSITSDAPASPHSSPREPNSARTTRSPPSSRHSETSRNANGPTGV